MELSLARLHSWSQQWLARDAPHHISKGLRVLQQLAAPQVISPYWWVHAQPWRQIARTDGALIGVPARKVPVNMGDVDPMPSP